MVEIALRTAIEIFTHPEKLELEIREKGEDEGGNFELFVFEKEESLMVELMHIEYAAQTKKEAVWHVWRTLEELREGVQEAASSNARYVSEFFDMDGRPVTSESSPKHPWCHTLNSRLIELLVADLRTKGVAHGADLFKKAA